MPIKGILIDTNEIIYALENKIDLYHLLNELSFPIRLYTTSRNVEELKGKIKGDIVNILGIKVIDASGKTDDAMIKVAKENDLMLFTEDRRLAERAKKEGLKVIKIKNRKTIEFY